MALVIDERADRADDRRVVRQPERFARAHRRRRGDVLEIDAFVHGDDARASSMSWAEQHLADALGGADEERDLPVLPARERVQLQREVDAARRDQAPAFGAASPARRRSRARSPPSPRRADRGRGRSPGCSSRRMRREPPRRGEIELGARRERNQVRALPTRAAAARRADAPPAPCDGRGARSPSTVSSAWFCPPRQVRPVSMCSVSMVQGTRTPAISDRRRVPESRPSCAASAPARAPAPTASRTSGTRTRRSSTR